MVSVSVGHSDDPAKTAEPIEMTFWMWGRDRYSQHTQRYLQGSSRDLASHCQYCRNLVTDGNGAVIIVTLW